MPLVLALGLLLVFGLLWANSRAVKPSLSQPVDVGEAMLAALAARPGQDIWLEQQVNALTKMGWSQASVAAFLLHLSETDQDWEELAGQAAVFGSPAFSQLLAAGLTDKGAGRDLLALSLKLLDFPRELTGRPSQVGQLLDRIWPDLTPHAAFWSLFANLVDLAFPGQALQDEDDLLARQIHQLRYLFSTYQADWVRRYYGGEGQSDRQALVAYLAQADARDRLGEWLGLTSYDYQLSYDLGQSSRLHNKRRPGQSPSEARLLFPENQETVNLKILINYHSEFILSSRGQLLNLLERWETGANGVLNGASFNYASRFGLRHQDLDIAPVRYHDPAFRRRLMRGYRSPLRRRLPWGQSWKASFYNARGDYALGQQSCYRAVKEMARGLTAEIDLARQNLRGQ